MANFNEIINGDKPVLIDFHAVWCGPCKMMGPILQDVSRKVGGRDKILKIDVDKNLKVAVKYWSRMPDGILGDLLELVSGILELHRK